MRVGIVINPISGRKGGIDAGQSRVERARQWCGRIGLDADIRTTTGKGDAERYARTFLERGYTRVVAWGGDGTVNETAGPLRGSPATLGIVPSGSGDGFARALGLSREPDRALGVALQANGRPIDVGLLGDRHFLNIGGIGFDAAIAQAFNARGRRGAATYIKRSLALVWSYRCRPYRIRLAGDTATAEATAEHFLIAFANGRQYGNGIVIAPEADPSDGWLDAVIVSGGSPVQQFWRARRLAWRPLEPAPGILRARVQSATVEGDVLECHVDGETFEAAGRIDVGIDPSAIKVAV